MITEQVYHHEVKDQTNLTYVWMEDQVIPFDELIVSFNAERPELGYFEISVSVLKGEWSEWLAYAQWSSSFQKSFSHKGAAFGIDQDVVEVKSATGFRVRIKAKEGADLHHFHALHTSMYKGFEKKLPTGDSVYLEVKGLSQLAQNPKFAKRICAATSTTAAVSYLKQEPIDPVFFAMGAYDSSFDVFGNWVFNVARAYEMLGPGWRCFVQRLGNFDGILKQLNQGIPVVVSVKGRLPKSHLPYDNGHLIAVIGYDAVTKQVICMDPAYPKNEDTIVRYPIGAFLDVWSARKGLAFLFIRIDTERDSSI